jgi:DNA-binding IscR family transcriptional regulator
MSSPPTRDPYGVALGAMRQFAHEGRFEPGDPLVVTDLAAEIGLSPTPIREALACLAGEGLIERQRGKGYFYPVLSAAEIIDLYELQRAYLHAALTIHYRGAPSLQRAAAGAAVSAGISSLFDAIIEQTGNSALAVAHARVAARLRTAARIESRLLCDDEEGDAMIAAAAEARLTDLLALLAVHHDRRCGLARQIASGLRSGLAAGSGLKDREGTAPGPP